MQYNSLILSAIALLSATSSAQDIDDNDVPQQCREICQPVVALTRFCDRNNNDNDSGFTNCVCTFESANTLIPLCESCVANYDRNDGSDNDVNDFVRSCSFTRTSWSDALFTQAVESVNTNVLFTTTASGGSEVVVPGVTTAPVSVSETVVITSAPTGPASSGSGSGSAAPQNTGAAAVVGVEAGLGAVAVVAGVFGLL